MKRNGLCPLCMLKRLFMKRLEVSEIYTAQRYDNSLAQTPPMGWSTWNTFKNRINQEVIYDTAKAMVDKGFLNVGYEYLNIDDNWMSNKKDLNGLLQGDMTTFSEGIPALIKKVNDLGLKVGLYSSNGTKTCEDLPTIWGNEKAELYNMASWGMEYFKFDFCHNLKLSQYAPLIYSVSVAPKGSSEGTEYPCNEAILEGAAKLIIDEKVSAKYHVCGLDIGKGSMAYNDIKVNSDGEYVLTVNIRKHGRYEKFLMVLVNDDESYEIEFSPQKRWNITARFQTVIKLRKGNNTIKLFNPVSSRAISAMLQYQKIGSMLIEASKTLAEKTGKKEKPILFSICEWGRNKPYKWGYTAGNVWRTTGDIFALWWRIVMIYEHNVKLHEYAGIGCWNDPDMLEVGNGKLTYDENIAHFSLWCMMNAPLILGNDIREVSQDVIDIVCKKEIIAINQDKLGKQAKRIIKGKVDILIKPLEDKSVAVCIFNKTKKDKVINFSIDNLIADEYINLNKAEMYYIEDLWQNESFETLSDYSCDVKSHGVKVYKIKAKD